MKSCLLTIACCAYLVAADVSHLRSSYLPPEHAVTTSIEQHELRELPEQVEYMRANPEGQMEQSLSSQLSPPAAQNVEMNAMLPSRYLPPAEPLQMAPEPPMEYMTAPAMQAAISYKPPSKINAQPAMQYLQPTQAEQPQPNYQQYQNQLLRLQMPEQQMEQQMPYVLDIQQPMAPSDVDTFEQDAMPAHQLHDDGYHYQTAMSQRRLRH